MGEKIEYWDIYDSNKELTGRTMKRNDWILQDGEYHLTVLGVVRRRDGKFLITRRVMTKAWAPGWWEVSGGGVMAGESSEEAVKRLIKSIVLLTTGKIRVREIIISWISIALPVILQRKM